MNMEESQITFTMHQKSFRFINKNGVFKVQEIEVIKPSTKRFRPLNMFRQLWNMMFTYTGEETKVIQEKNLFD